MGNPFVHVELHTTDTGKAKAFYTSLFDWKIQDVPTPQGPYTLIDVGGGTGGGMFKTQAPGQPSAWLPYVLVGDIRASTEKAKTLGATVCLDVMQVMGKGFLSVLSDPTGAMIGLWQPTGGVPPKEAGEEDA